ncbi:phosphotransferase [Arthrobacter sp. B3I4]|uniref:phosphotransferase n=1 Tax=Arthrobacter sp. B3I4 TaxID=3042267 RepID=UPI00278027CA|nr:phosphotransferase [Arthrobacter sp. B3I4]MDQ0754649.1 Ser/Thr protein kinase RdoA (MazF antagonist) [Arthrobacter sp. B3I4]
MANEEILTGGNSSVVVRVGDTVRRNSGPWTPAVHALLDALHAAGVTGVPVAAGLDDLGREVLSFLPGETVQYPLPAWVWHPAILAEAGKLLRQFHDASVDLVRTRLTWQLASHEPIEVVCHNDFAPYNMAFEDRKLAGVFDFDAASPGPRIWDFAYLAYQLVPLIRGTGPGEPEAAEKLPRLNDLIAVYGRPFTHREVFETLAVRLLELAEYSDRRAAETGRTELNDHAAMYRGDSARMARLAEDA